MTKGYTLACVAIALAGAGLSAGFATILPDVVPTHWNLRGEADAYGSKWQLLLIIPAVSLGFIGLFLALPLLGPFRRSFEQFRITYGRICVAILTAQLALHLVILLKADGRLFSIGPAVTVVIGPLLALLGNWMGKIRRNFYVGIRTPWTLASEAVWERTHRVGGRLMVGHGLLVTVAGLFADDLLCFLILVGGLVVLAIVITLYSLICYHRLGRPEDLTEPNRV